MLRDFPWRVKHLLQRVTQYFKKIGHSSASAFIRLRISAVLTGIDDWITEEAKDEILPVPPPLLRYRVHGFLGLQGFLLIGQHCARDIRSLLKSIDRDIYSFSSVLDFGCGCGRVLRFFYDRPASCQFYGTDIDGSAISWCKKHLQIANWSTNNQFPPMAYRNRTFDLIYGISVLTHLNEEMQFEWLRELKRVSTPGGVLILTIHGAEVLRRVMLPEKVKADLLQKGFSFLIMQTGRFKLDGLPDFYQSAFHTKEYILREWSKYFRVAKYVEAGLDGYQDAVVLFNDLAQD